MNDQQTEGQTSLFNRWVFGLNSIGTLWIFLIMLLINTDVLLRFLFNSPIDGVTEIVEVSIAGIVFLQLADAIRAGRLTRSDGLFNKIRASKPLTGQWMSIVFDICGALFFVAILFGAVPTFIEAYERNYFAGSEGVFTIAIWPIRLILCISCLTVIGVFITKIISQIRSIGSSQSAGGAL